MSGKIEVLALILEAGKSNHLRLLTERLPQLEICIGGKYRLIDFPISNCINSGINHIAVLGRTSTIPSSHELNLSYPSSSEGWVKTWEPQSNDENDGWYQGTAAAVRQQIQKIIDSGAENVLILINDHLYRMDYDKLIKFHQKMKADITIGVHSTGAFPALQLGIVKTSINGRVLNYNDRPANLKILADSASRNDPAQPFLSPMGIYLCRTEMLLELLNGQNFNDFGKQVIPYAVENKRIYAYEFDGSWEDINSVRSYYEVNLELTQTNPPVNLYDHDHPIFHEFSQLPAPKLIDCLTENAILADGCWIKDALIRRSIVGERCQIGQGVVITDSILMGMDDYPPDPIRSDHTDGFLTVGRNSKISGAIVDRNARIGERVIIQPFHAGTFINAQDWVVCDGIVVIKSNHYIKNASYIGPLIKYQAGDKPENRMAIKPGNAIKNYTSYL